MFEFSTLRRAIYSTQMLLKECTPGFGDRVTYTCNNCGKGIDEKVMRYDIIVGYLRARERLRTFVFA